MENHPLQFYCSRMILNNFVFLNLHFHDNSAL
ncbi:hypothetical protein T05_4483 [Trichinella murrelli]|uniref:Uncharacterized protein n=1 Tax=Trichinella murrelli TaxID=144512 RepID=A0A0V0SQ86_9BILA|nr:hypothetical protein T05_4483 [Trichinella murrelli]